MPPLKLKALGRYKVRGVLGRGNMGVVYRGHDPIIDRPVAIKTVALPETLSEAERDAFLERFLLEARTAGKLIHPNVVVTHDAATDEETGIPFIAMEFVAGETLAERLSWQQRLPWSDALAVTIPIAEALEHAHRSGVVHRDIKPELMGLLDTKRYLFALSKPLDRDVWKRYRRIYAHERTLALGAP